MSRNAEIVIPWADGDYKFRLGLGEIRELQEKCDAGPQWIYQRIAENVHGGWRIDDIRETLRLGLIGGGLDAPKALVLVKRYVDKRPLIESRMAAQAVLAAMLVGAEDEQLEGKAEATNGAAGPSSHAVKSVSLPSTAPGPSSG